MRILFDINHPAHAHFFKNAMAKLSEQGHSIRITASSKECTAQLLEQQSIEFCKIEGTHDGSILDMSKVMISRDWKLRRFVKESSPDVLAAIGGTFVAHVGRMTSAKSVVFYDTAEAKLQNLITYPFVHRLVVPKCYDGWTPKKRTVRYTGTHELAYLAPTYFLPSRVKALNVGLHPSQPTILMRLVSWKANHDLGLSGISVEFVEALISKLEARAKVIISSEETLPGHLQKYRYIGPANEIHHLMAHAAGLVSESATMAAESAALGVPALLVGPSTRCYAKWLEDQYSLIRTINDPSLQDALCAVYEWLDLGNEVYSKRREQLVHDCVDVNDVICANILALAE